MFCHTSSFFARRQFRRGPVYMFNWLQVLNASFMVAWPTCHWVYTVKNVVLCLVNMSIPIVHVVWQLFTALWNRVAQKKTFFFFGKGVSFFPQLHVDNFFVCFFKLHSIPNLCFFSVVQYIQFFWTLQKSTGLPLVLFYHVCPCQSCIHDSHTCQIWDSWNPINTNIT